MEQERFRQVSQTFHKGFGLRGGASEMLMSSPVDNQPQCYQPSDPLHPHFHPQFRTSYTQLMDSGNPSVISKLDEIAGGRQCRSTDEVCRFDPLQEPAPLFHQARLSAQSSLVSLLPDPEFLIEDNPNGLHSLESDSKPPVQCPRSQNAKHNEENGPALRFRPNDQQKRLLENHFQSGLGRPALAKPTRELFEAVQEAGDATKRQITVWLKNRRSREKRGTKKVKKHELPDQELQPFQNQCFGAPEQVCPPFASRMTRWIQPMDDFASVMSSVINELDLILKHVDQHELENLCRSLMNKSRIVCHAMGKEGHIMNKFASDLNTLGFQATSLNDIATLPVSSEDLFIVSAGPSCHSSVSSLCLEAIRMGACVIAFTAHSTADALFTDRFVRIPGQILTRALPGQQELSQPGTELISFLPDGRESVMNMGSSYEVGLSLVHALVLMMLKQQLQRSILLR